MRINYSDEKIVDSDKSIFLAGPTPRGENAKSWRVDACKKLEELGFDGVVYVPEYSSWKPKEDYVESSTEQVETGEEETWWQALINDLLGK